MEIIIKEDNLTVSHKLEPEWPNEVSPAEAMIAAYDVLSRIFGQRRLSTLTIARTLTQWPSGTTTTF